MTTIDTSKSVWKVKGKLPEPDGRGYTCVVNAESKAEAFELARQGMISASFEDAWEIDTVTGQRKGASQPPHHGALTIVLPDLMGRISGDERLIGRNAVRLTETVRKHRAEQGKG
jgi:hypothetical protein